MAIVDATLMERIAANLLAQELRIWGPHARHIWNLLTEGEKQQWRDKVHAMLDATPLASAWRSQFNANSLAATIAVNDIVGTPEYLAHLREVSKPYGIVWDDD